MRRLAGLGASAPTLRCAGGDADISGGQTGHPSAGEETIYEGTEPFTGEGSGARRLNRGDQLGRYTVLRRIGEGGMGVVYEAYDPELDRKVAVKLVRTVRAQRGGDERARLLREAQAMARLSHPNVIAVHDVGTVGEHVFVAMELVDGDTLAKWVGREQRSWREVRDVMVKAGRGLAAAHAQGLIHRDFKPDNILVGHDGRVRVLDFGLARAVGESIPTPAPTAKTDALTHSGGLANSDTLNSPLTRTGAMLGTPAYMAAEQHLGRAADERSDQYSFCVAAYEALYGERPFAGEDLPSLAFQVTQGKVRDAPKSAAVPAWLRRVLLRGLRPDPSDRWPAMDALLTELSRDPARRRRRWLGTAGIAAAAGVTAFVLADAGGEDEIVCDGGAAELDAAWGSARRAQIEQAFSATNKPYAADAWSGVKMALSRYATRWSDMHRGACEATHVRREQSGELLDLRMACLGRRLDELSALTELLAQADAKLVERSVGAASSLTPLETCDQIELLQAQVPEPEDPEVRARVAEVRHAIASAAAHKHAGRYAEGIEVAAEAAEHARGIGHAPLTAEALYWLGNLRTEAGENELAEQVLYEAAQAAAAGKHDEVAAETWTLLVFVVGERQLKNEEGQALGRMARAAVVRAGDLPGLRATLENYLGALAVARGDLDVALEHEQRALAIREQQTEEPMLLAASLYSIGRIHIYAGRQTEALRAFERALGVWERSVGPDHPKVAYALSGTGSVLHEQERYDEALAQFQRVAEIWRGALGADHPNMAIADANIGNALRGQGKLAEAREHYERGAAKARSSFGAEHPITATLVASVGDVALREGEHDEAQKHLTEALAVHEKAGGKEHPNVAEVLIPLGDLARERSRLDEAESHYRRALAIREKVGGPEDPTAVPAILGLCEVALTRKRNDEALALAQRALKIRESGPSGPEALEKARAAVERARAAAGR